MKMQSFFDSNCVIGRRSIRRSGQVNEAEFYSIESLLAEMDYAGIDDALVYHSLAREYDPMLGNRKLMDEIKPHQHLHPCWVVMPAGTGEFPEPGSLGQEMQREGVKAVRLFPTDHSYSLSEWCSGELLKSLESDGILVVIEINQIGWEGVHSLCSRYPELSLLLTNVGYRDSRNLYPLLAKFENLYVETSSYQGHKSIEAVCNRFSARRLVFGTRLPIFAPGPAVNMVNYSLIGDDEKEMIAGNNLRRLLGLAEVKKTVPAKPSDLKSRAALARSMEGEVIIDAHCHMGPYFNFFIPDNDAGFAPADWDSIVYYAYPEYLGNRKVACAAILEAADRTYRDNWDNNLDGILYRRLKAPLMYNVVLHYEEYNRYLFRPYLLETTHIIRRLADSLYAHGAKACFQMDWCIVEGIRRYDPGLLIELKSEGHEVTTHAHGTVYTGAEITRMINDLGEYRERALEILEALPPEKNAIIRRWEETGIGAESAFYSQALIRLKKEYCDRGRCLECGMGLKIITGKRR